MNTTISLCGSGSETLKSIRTPVATERLLFWFSNTFCSHNSIVIFAIGTMNLTMSPFIWWSCYSMLSHMFLFPWTRRLSRQSCWSPLGLQLDHTPPSPPCKIVFSFFIEKSFAEPRLFFGGSSCGDPILAAPTPSSQLWKKWNSHHHRQVQIEFK